MSSNPQALDSRPCAVFRDGLIKLFTHAPHARLVEEFLLTIGEPVTRPEHIHEYQLTTFSLYGAVSAGVDSDEIVMTLQSFSKNVLDPELVAWIRRYAQGLGKVRFMLGVDPCGVTTPLLESPDWDLLSKLEDDPDIRPHVTKALDRTGHMAGRGGGVGGGGPGMQQQHGGTLYILFLSFSCSV